MEEQAAEGTAVTKAAAEVEDPVDDGGAENSHIDREAEEAAAWRAMREAFGDDSGEAPPLPSARPPPPVPSARAAPRVAEAARAESPLSKRRRVAGTVASAGTAPEVARARPAAAVSKTAPGSPQPSPPGVPAVVPGSIDSRARFATSARAAPKSTEAGSLAAAAGNKDDAWAWEAGDEEVAAEDATGLPSAAPFGDDFGDDDDIQ